MRILERNHYVGSIFRKDKEKRIKNDETIMTKNIYEVRTRKEYYKKFHPVHFLFKYKFLVPLLRIGRRLLRNSLVTKPPKGHHNRNLIIFNEAYNEAVIKFHTLFTRNTGPKQKRMSKKEAIKKAHNDINLHAMKEIINTMYVYDTAYREFVNILLHEITHKMSDYYTKRPGKKENHLFYTVDLYETNYFVLEKMISQQVQLQIENAEKALEEQENERKNKRK